MHRTKVHFPVQLVGHLMDVVFLSTAGLFGPKDNNRNTRIMVTLLNALERRDLKTGVAAICIGGGEAIAIALERLG